MSRTRRWSIALLAVCGFAASQAVLAGHQFAHDDGVVAESCAICIQLEQFQSALAPSTPALVPFLYRDLPAVGAVSLPASGAFTHYASRAPPIF